MLPHPADAEGFARLFEAADKKGRGKISTSVFSDVIAETYNLELSRKNLRSLEDDFGGDGQVRYEEIAQAVKEASYNQGGDSDDGGSNKNRKSRGKSKRSSASSAIIAREVKRTLQEECPSTKKVFKSVFNDGRKRRWHC